MSEQVGNAFLRLWVSVASSNVADGMIGVAAQLAALRIGTTATEVAGVSVAFTFGMMAGSLPAGTIVDRVDRRRLMLGGNLARAGAVGAVALTIGSGATSLGVLYVAMVALGAAMALIDTTAQSTVPMLVASDRLTTANGRLQSTQLAGEDFVGGPIAGLLVPVALLAGFLVPAALYVAAALPLLRLRGSLLPQRSSTTRMRDDLIEGITYLWRQPLLRALTVVATVLNLALSGATAVLVLFVVGPDSPMGLNEPAFPLLLACLATGSVVGGLAAQRLESRFGITPMIVSMVVSSAAAVAILAITARTGLVVAALALLGFVVMIANVASATLRQRLVPEGMLGRATAGMRLFAMGLSPVGAAAAGPLADLISVQAVFAAAAITILLAAPALAPLRRAPVTTAVDG